LLPAVLRSGFFSSPKNSDLVIVKLHRSVAPCVRRLPAVDCARKQYPRLPPCRGERKRGQLQRTGINDPAIIGMRAITPDSRWRSNLCILCEFANFEPLHFRIGIRRDSQPRWRNSNLRIWESDPLHSFRKSAHFTPFVGHPRLLPTRCATRPLSNGDADVRILPPQPRSPVSTSHWRMLSSWRADTG
jgi:hypothetical protein